MKYLPIILVKLFIAILISQTTFAQKSKDTEINKDTKFVVVNDTLISESGRKIFVGQKLKLGKPSGNNNSYRSIISKYAALVPNIWGNNNGLKHLIENYVDNKKGKKQLAELIPGQIFTIGKIVKTGKKEFQFYYGKLLTESTNYGCDILFALELGELTFD
jgi:hypothetical protein